MLLYGLPENVPGFVVPNVQESPPVDLLHPSLEVAAPPVISTLDGEVMGEKLLENADQIEDVAVGARNPLCHGEALCHKAVAVLRETKRPLDELLRGRVV